MKWLCKISVHKWKPFGYNSLVFPIPIYRCERCGRGVQHYPYCTYTYTKEQMEAALGESNGVS